MKAKDIYTRQRDSSFRRIRLRVKAVINIAKNTNNSAMLGVASSRLVWRLLPMGKRHISIHPTRLVELAYCGMHSVVFYQDGNLVVHFPKPEDEMRYLLQYRCDNNPNHIVHNWVSVIGGIKSFNQLMVSGIGHPYSGISTDKMCDSDLVGLSIGTLYNKSIASVI